MKTYRIPKAPADRLVIDPMKRFIGITTTSGCARCGNPPCSVNLI
jgi:hypothetical protein